MTTPGKKTAGIPMGPGYRLGPPTGQGTPLRPGDMPQPATAREKALEDAIQTIRGCATMARLEAAGIHYIHPSVTWRVAIHDTVYNRSDLAEIIEIIGRLGPPDKPEKEQDDGKE